MTIPQSMKALVVVEGKKTAVQEKAVPKLCSAGQVLVQVDAVALNPTDWKAIARGMALPGVISGCDFAGTVVEVKGDDGAAAAVVKQGDRVAGFVHGGKWEDNGAFAQYVRAEARLLVKVPDGMDAERASTVGVGGCTASQALFQRLGLRFPSAESTSLPEVTSNSDQVLVWAGSTSSGQWAIQLARAAGYHVIATASPANHAFLKEMGAAEVYDYRDASVPDTISKEHPRLSVALDCFSEDGSQSLCVRSLGTQAPGKVCVLLKPEEEAVALRDDVKIIHTLTYTVLGKPFKYGPTEYGEEQVATDKNFIQHFTNGDQGILAHLLKHNLITGGRVKVMDGGIERVAEGLAMLEQGKVSANKLTYKLA